VTGLGIFPGRVVRFRRPPEFKIPHMGWNTVRFVQRGTPLDRSARRRRILLFRAQLLLRAGRPRSLVLAECDYGGAFTAAIARGRVFATQFHPEKSQAKGLQIYRNFVRLAAAGWVQTR
jgi:glutamine amidotransferase